MAEASPFLENIILFGRALRAAGLPVTQSQTNDFVRALGLVDLGHREQVFHAGRATLVNRRDDLAVFAAVFARFWKQGRRPHSDAREKRQSAAGTDGSPGNTARVRQQAVDLMEPDGGAELTDRSRRYSNLELLRHTDFAELSAAELEAIGRLITGMRWRFGWRRTRRWSAASRGPRLDLRRLLRDTVHSGGAALQLARRRRKTKRRPLVLLADISGSMETYSRVILQFFYGAMHAEGRREVECFLFGTRLTRVTQLLRARNVDRALDGAVREARDWSGGTRIGECLATFNRDWARRVLGRGSVVVIVSDGWERGDVSELGSAMRHLSLRCHRLVWLNPHSGRTGYRPRVEGMATALPYVDDFLPAGDLASLEAMNASLAGVSGGKSARRSLPTSTHKAE